MTGNADLFLIPIFVVACSTERQSPNPICKLAEIRFSGTVLFDGGPERGISRLDGLRERTERRLRRDRLWSPCRIAADETAKR